ncbi:putative DNA processing protein DprA [Austwickia sp. TVS 96-490-7B]|uniref:DNA-processing protein DprA n=1 Tax=Austwickia sp. TVS 96-490-7B TaxID=2830843 RepID=UPI001C58C5A6|nr:DNA-processing protein DprA [Austwickia sp. TVS 96-490-7B]MBW3084509.1 putative DNA processing protein DprA [Austwickia sp. TVS 96-490-7B]
MTRGSEAVLPGLDSALPAWPSSWGACPQDDRTARALWSRIAEPGDPRAGALIAAYGAVGALAQVPGIPEGMPGGRFAGRLVKADLSADLDRAARVGARVVVPGDQEWPVGVDDLAHPPIALWVRGPLSLAEACERSVAIVGARACTPYGQHVAADVAAGLGRRGFTVVSGAAFGIDVAAHRGALAVGAPTVAVLAGGVDRAYPVAHTALLEEIARVGAVVSEVPPGAAPMRQRFLLRNRLIAACTTGTLVVEAGLRSGSRHTAGVAADLHRVVMAVPGPVSSSQSAGCHEMIRQGMAVLVTDADEVAEEAGSFGVDLAPVRRGPRTVEDDLDPVAARVRDALPVRVGGSVESIAAVAGVDQAQARSALGRLDLAGLAERDGWGWRRRVG